MEEGVKRAKLYSPKELAFVGDSVYELAVRTAVLKGTAGAKGLSEISKIYTNATAQSKILSSIMGFLTEEELDIVRRGKSAKVKAYPKRAGKRMYREATALECLFGFIYLSEKLKRIEELSMLCVSVQLETKGVTTGDG